MAPSLLAVGTGRASGAVSGGSAHPFMCETRGSGLADVVAMLTAELDRHGRKLEIDHVASGERAVDRVKALKRHGLFYWVIVFEVEGSLAVAKATAREIRYETSHTLCDRAFIRFGFHSTIWLSFIRPCIVPRRASSREAEHGPVRVYRCLACS